jgi:hypothetical protein
MVDEAYFSETSREFQDDSSSSSAAGTLENDSPLMTPPLDSDSSEKLENFECNDLQADSYPSQLPSSHVKSQVPRFSKCTTPSRNWGRGGRKAWWRTWGGGN